MTNSELKAAMLAKVPVIHRDKRRGTAIKYDRISAIRYYPGGNGKIIVSVELLDERSDCVVIADGKEIEEAE